MIVRVNNTDNKIKFVNDDLKNTFRSGKAITNSKSLSPFSFINNGDLYFFKPIKLV